MRSRSSPQCSCSLLLVLLHAALYVFALFLFGLALGLSMRALLTIAAVLLAVVVTGLLRLVSFVAGAPRTTLLPLCLRSRLSALLLLFTVLLVSHEWSRMA